MDRPSTEHRDDEVSQPVVSPRQPSMTSPKPKKQLGKPSTGVTKRTPPKLPRYRSVSAPLTHTVAPAQPTPVLTGSSNAPIELDSASEDEPAITPLSTRQRSPKANPPVTPVSKARSVSYPTLSPAGTPSQSINAAIERLIRKEVGVSDTRGQKGFVYVLAAVHNGRRLVKIGHTADGGVDKRRKSIERTCTAIQFPPSTTDHQQIRTYYKLVEQLAHLELQDHRYPIVCTCGKRHREYFAVDEKVAYRVVRHWIHFCEQRPWRDYPYSVSPGLQARSAITITPATTGPIKPEWLDRLEQHSRSSSDREPLNASSTAADLETRLAHWDVFTSPSLGAWLWYDLRQAWAGLWRCVWELCCVLQGLRILWLTWDWSSPPWVGLLAVVWPLVCTLRKAGEIRSAAVCWLVRRFFFVAGGRGFLPLTAVLVGGSSSLWSGFLSWLLHLDNDPGVEESRQEPEVFVGGWVTTDGEDDRSEEDDCDEQDDCDEETLEERSAGVPGRHPPVRGRRGSTRDNPRRCSDRLQKGVPNGKRKEVRKEKAQGSNLRIQHRRRRDHHGSEDSRDEEDDSEDDSEEGDDFQEEDGSQEEDDSDEGSRRRALAKRSRRGRYDDEDDCDKCPRRQGR